MSEIKTLSGKINNNKVELVVKHDRPGGKPAIIVTVKFGSKSEDHPIFINKISAIALTKDEYNMAVEHITKDFDTLLKYVQAGQVRIEMNGQIKH